MNYKCKRHTCDVKEKNVRLLCVILKSNVYGDTGLISLNYLKSLSAKMLSCKLLHWFPFTFNLEHIRSRDFTSSAEQDYIVTFDLWQDYIVTVRNVSKYGVFSGPYFPVFGLSTERYEVSLRIWDKYINSLIMFCFLFCEDANSIILTKCLLSVCVLF